MSHQMFEEWFDENEDSLYQEYLNKKKLVGDPQNFVPFYDWAKSLWIREGVYGGGS